MGKQLSAWFASYIEPTIYSLLVLQLFGCGPTITNIHDKTEVSSDAVVVIGRLALPVLTKILPNGRMFISIGNPENRGFKAVHDIGQSPDYFLSGQSRQENFFFWYLSPGDYVIKSFHTSSWGIEAGVRESSVTQGWTEKRIWASFSVPKGTEAVYIGSVIIDSSSEDLHIRDLIVLDEFEKAKIAYVKKFQGPETIVHKSLLSWKPPR